MSENPTTLPTQLGGGEDLAALVNVDDGLISRRIFTDPAIFELEKERIFGRAWFFVGHETEIPEPGDLVARPVGMDPGILVRDDEGEIRVLLNSCRHRGMRVCRTDRENARFLRCPYHGWVYKTSGELVSAAAESHYGPDELRKEEFGLIQAAQVDQIQGLIFATWDPEAPPLQEYLGDMAYYLDLVFGRTDGGLEVVGTPQVWEVDTAWKFGTDNYTDNYHVFSTHHSLVDLGMLPNDPDFASHGHMIDAGNGHVLHFVQGPPDDEEFRAFGLPEELREQMRRNLPPDKLQIAEPSGISVGTVWPTFHYMHLQSSDVIDGKQEPFMNLRMEEPISPTRTRMWAWFMVDRTASPEFKRRSQECYVRTFGPAGLFDQDDMENWEDCTRANMGPAARRYTLHHRMGVDREPISDWPGPGRVWADSYGEMTQRAWYGQWLRQMQGE
ncbi:MAG: Rieske 2Fe-2S domain-containing protein [Actinobacteria bacterium]|nr:Rieske 2Fe-2S domain-containing protein [Actinomycetota bacterium]